MDERIIQAFLERGFFKNQNEVVSAALKALVREQRQADSEMQNEESLADQATYEMQLEGNENATDNATQKMGNLVG
jgi:Arc/MetJ-type ribon-helix-helix transcriptional regulator